MNLVQNALDDPQGFARVLTAGKMIVFREDDKYTAAIGLTVNR